MFNINQKFSSPIAEGEKMINEWNWDMVLLNGEYVDKAMIDPAKHKFIGVFRPLSYPKSDGTWGVWECSCGHNLQVAEACHAHWMLGHMDIPHYVDIYPKRLWLSR
jgi:hypothetical protein